MVKIRLERIGRKNTPHYRVVVTPSERKQSSHHLQQIGTYNPVGKQFNIDREAYTLWINKGAQPTERVKRLFEGIAAYQK